MAYTYVHCYEIARSKAVPLKVFLIDKTKSTFCRFSSHVALVQLCSNLHVSSGVLFQRSGLK